jgi:hypothetical protein
VSRSKAKGTAWETKVVHALRLAGFVHAERRSLNGVSDRGDVAGVIGTVIETKNCQRTELAEWVDEAERERRNDGARYGVVWHHRRGRSEPADGFVTMSGASFLRLLADALDIDPEVNT